MSNEILTPYEKYRGLVSRVKLRDNILSLMDDLTDEQFHHIYGLIWDIGATNMLLRFSKEEVKSLKNKGVSE